MSFFACILNQCQPLVVSFDFDSAGLCWSLRTTVPASIVKQFNLKDGDKLDWTLKVEDGELIIVIKPLMKK